MYTEGIINDLKNTLSRKRFLHSLGTMNAAEELAKIYNADIKKSKIAAIFHDVAKELSDDEILDYAKRYDIFIDENDYDNINILHGMIGAEIALHKYHIEDLDILNAIRYHTTGRNGMSLLDKIIYVADLIEENRDYSDVEKVRKLARKNLNEAVLYILEWTIKILIKKGKTINKNTFEARNYLILEKRGNLE